MAKPRVPAVDGWFTLDPPALIGTRCAKCGTYHFPKEKTFCRNPGCDGTELADVPLSRRGTVWSFTTNHYKAPPPFVAPEPFAPYTLAAVELVVERMIVLGRLAEDGRPGPPSVGDEVELAIGTLYEDDENEYVVWQWQPVGAP